MFLHVFDNDSDGRMWFGQHIVPSRYRAVAPPNSQCVWLVGQWPAGGEELVDGSLSWDAVAFCSQVFVKNLSHAQSLTYAVAKQEI